MPDNNLPQKVYDLERKVEDNRRYIDERIRMHDHNGNDAQRVSADDLLGEVTLNVTTDELPRSRVYVGGFFTSSPTTVTTNTTGLLGSFSFWESIDSAIVAPAHGQAGVLSRASTGGSVAVGEGAGIGTLDIDISASRNPRSYCILKVESGVTHHRVEYGFTNRASTTLGTAEPDDGFYFRTVENSNWQAVTRSGGVETASDTGVAVSTTNYQLLDITATTTSVIFKINNSTVATHTTNITSAVNLGLNHYNSLITSTASGVRYSNITEMHGWWDQYSF